MLITNSNVKSYLKITSTDFDTLLTTIATQASAYISKLIGRVLDSTTYYEVYSGDGSTEIIVNHYPIITLNMISDDISLVDRTYSSVIDTNYIVVDKTRGILSYPDGEWLSGDSNIYVEYTAGYSTYPADLQMIAITLACKKFNDIQDKRFGIQTKNVMQENISFDISDLSKNDVTMLDVWRKKSYSDGIAVTKFSGDS